MKCGTALQARDLIPMFSYIFLGGRCRYCREKVSLQYPFVEILNGSLWVVTFLLVDDPVKSILYCLMISGLLVLSVIDWRTFEIPFGINVYLFVIGLIREIVDGISISILLDFALVSGFLLFLFLITRGRGIGGGD
ncbi:prepilin peptidase, partial [Lachnoclostridium sp.]